MEKVKEALLKLVKKNKYTFVLLILLVFGPFELLKDKYDSYGTAVFIFLTIVTLLFFFVFVFNKKTDPEKLFFLLFMLGFYLRLAYILDTNGAVANNGGYFITRQHDVHYFFGPESYAPGTHNGHAAYIEFFTGGGILPDFDVRTVFQFYHPPLWHMISALWLKIQEFFGISYYSAIENIQILSLVCSTLIMTVSHGIFKKFGLKDFGLIIADAIVAFHPTFIILAGSINNDVLSLVLVLTSVYLALRWYEAPGFKTIVPLAFSIGFAMMAKLSGGLVAVAVAMLFFLHLFNKKYGFKRLFPQFAVFGIICIPIALWYQIRNYFAYGVPPAYVPKLSVKADQYVGNVSVLDRIFDFSSLSENGVYPARATETYMAKYGFEYFDHNIPLTALKTSVFGEYYIGASDRLFSIVAEILFWSSVILAVLSCVFAVYSVVKAFREKSDNRNKALVFHAFMLVYWLTLIISYVNFCFGYPHFCTMDFRYIAPTVIIGALYIGLFLNKIKNKNNIVYKVFYILLTAVTAAFALGSVGLYVFAV